MKRSTIKNYSRLIAVVAIVLAGTISARTTRATVNKLTLVLTISS